MPGPVSFFAGRPELRARILTVLPVLVLLGTLGSLVFNCAITLANTDTYFHLRFGEEFLHGWSLRQPGSVSTFATADWVPTQWASEIVMTRTEQWFGLAGLAWLSGLLQIALFLTLYAAARRRADPLVAVSVTAAALYGMQASLSMRPQVVSYLLVVVVVAAWLRTRDDHRVRWWLIAVVWVWGTLHGMWPVAIVIGAVAVVGLALDRAPRGFVLRAALVPLGSAVAAALTPVGPSLYSAVSAVGARRLYFTEWGSPDWTSSSSLVLAALLAVTAVALWRCRRNSWTELLLILLAGGFAVYSQRTVPIAASMLAPLAAAPLQALFGGRTPVVHRERVAVAGCAALTLVVLALLVPHTSGNPPDQPSWADPALSRLPVGTEVVDDWGWGGYLMWRYPQLDLMMHGYGDTFTTPELDRNISLIRLYPGWDTLLHDTGARVAFLRSDSRLAAELRVQGWRIVHDSDTFVMLRAPASWISSGPAVARLPGSAG